MDTQLLNNMLIHIKTLFETGYSKQFTVLDISEALKLANDMLIIQYADDGYIDNSSIMDMVDLYRASVITHFNLPSNNTTKYNLEIRALTQTVHNVLVQLYTDIDQLIPDLTDNHTIFNDLAAQVIDLYGKIDPTTDIVARQVKLNELAKQAPSLSNSDLGILPIDIE